MCLKMTQQEYYNERWDSENTAERPPATTRVRIVAETVMSVLESKSSRILDVGCGNGWILEAIRNEAQGAATLFGVEPSQSGANNSSVRVPDACIEIGTLSEVNFNTQFDLVVTSEVIEHVPNKTEFLSQIASVLHDDGTLVLTTPNGLYRNSYFEDNPDLEPQPIEEWVTAAELESLCSQFFTKRWVRTFGPEYFFSRNSWALSARRRIDAVQGGRHVRSRMDRFVSRTLGRGLNILAVFDKRCTEAK